MPQAHFSKLKCKKNCIIWQIPLSPINCCQSQIRKCFVYSIVSVPRALWSTYTVAFACAILMYRCLDAPLQLRNTPALVLDLVCYKYRHKERHCDKGHRECPTPNLPGHPPSWTHLFVATKMIASSSWTRASKSFALPWFMIKQIRKKTRQRVVNQKPIMNNYIVRNNQWPPTNHNPEPMTQPNTVEIIKCVYSTIHSAHALICPTFKGTGQPLRQFSPFSTASLPQVLREHFI